MELPGGSYSVSDIQDYVGSIIKKHKKPPTNPPIHFYFNRINNKLLSKIKDGYKVELQTPEIIKLFHSTKKLIDKKSSGENVRSLEAAKVVLLKCNLVNDQYQQKSEILFTFTSNKSHDYLQTYENL